MNKEFFKTICPIAGGLMLGDSIGALAITKGPIAFPIIELIVGTALIISTFILIFKK